jgi:hypothetical protein
MWEFVECIALLLFLAGAAWLIYFAVAVISRSGY